MFEELVSGVGKIVRARASEIGREVFDGILEAGVGIGFDEMRDEFLAKGVGVN